jgi:hypothetical protein
MAYQIDLPGNFDYFAVTIFKKKVIQSYPNQLRTSNKPSLNALGKKPIITEIA